MSVTFPRRPNESWVLRTQMVGSIDSLQSRRSTWCPYRRPTKNQELSAIRHPIRAASNASGKLTLCSADSAPAASSTGVAGSGIPTCSTRTQTKRSK